MNSFHFILGEGEDVVDSKGKSVKVKKKKKQGWSGILFSVPTIKVKESKNYRTPDKEVPDYLKTEQIP